MAGLDNIKHYNGEEGSSVSSDTATEAQAPLSVKAVASKSPYALPTPMGVTGVDPQLLKNMEDLIAEREARKNSFLESMKDATAWWSGGMAGPGEALARRAKERDEFEATTFGMKRDIAQNKIAQAQAEANQRAIFGAPAAETGAQMAGTTPGAASGAPAGAPSVPQGGLLGLVRNPDLRQSIANQATRDQKGAFTAIQNYLAKNAEDPQLVKEVNAAINNGWLDPKLVPSVVLTKMAGSGAFVPHDVRTPGGTTQGTPLAAASALSGGAPINAAPAAARPAPTPTTTAPSAPSPVAAATTPTVAPTTTAAKPALPHAQPLPTITPPAAQPLVAPNLQTGLSPGSKEDLALKQKAAESKIELGAEQQKPVEKAAGESAVSLVNSAGRAKDNIQQYDMAESILRQYPKAFGISQDGSVTAMLSQLIGPGVTVPIVGTLKAPGLEEARAQKLGPKALAARATFDTLASRFATEYANQNLTGEGRGTLSNADMKMAGVAKGLSKDSPAATNLIFAILNRENEQMLLERGNAWTQYQKDMRNAGQQADFNRFRETEAYTKAMDAKEARIAKRFPEFFKDQAKTSEGGTKTAKDFFNR
jgi:hypothetical protein